MPRTKDQDWLNDIKIGEELKYPKAVIEELKNESNQVKRSKILQNARHDSMRKRSHIKIR